MIRVAVDNTAESEDAIGCSLTIAAETVEVAVRADAIEASSIITVTFDVVEDKAEAMKLFIFKVVLTEAELEIAEAIYAFSTRTAVIEAEEEIAEPKAVVAVKAVDIEAALDIAEAIDASSTMTTDTEAELESEAVKTGCSLPS